MLYTTLLSGLALLAGFVSAIPSALDQSVGLVPRGGKDKCPDCPPDKSGCQVGCLYLKCKDATCCKKLGLQDNKPQFLFYDNPLGTIPNVHLNPGTSTLFTWCPSDDLLLDIRGHPLGFLIGDNNELNLVAGGNGVTTQTFDVGLFGVPGQVVVDVGSDHSGDFWVCIESGVLSIHQGTGKGSQDPFENCCAAELFFSTDVDKK